MISANRFGLLDYVHPNNFGSQLGIMQVQYSDATYRGTQHKQNTNGYITGTANANRYDAHKLIDVLTN